MQEIRISCEVQRTLPLEVLTPLQGNLKTLSVENFEKLKKSILTNGFSFPFFVWADGGPPAYLLDGHQRLRVLSTLKQQGYQLPPEFPVVYIAAADLKHAKQKLLLATSAYGKMEAQGLYEFLSGAEIPIEIAFDQFEPPLVDVDKFRAEYLDQPVASERELPPAEPLKQIFEVVVVLKSEADQRAAYEKLTAEGFECRVLSM